MQKLIQLIGYALMLASSSALSQTTSAQPLRVATFNVSMEALNYLPYVKGKAPKVVGNELSKALATDHQQIRNIAEIIQKINPDVILLNEFDRQDNSHRALKTFIHDYLAKGQNGNQGIEYPYFYQGPVNTGVSVNQDVNNDGKASSLPADTHGFGYFPGHFGMALLSKYPIDTSLIRSFQLFKWQDMPNALKPTDPATGESWYKESVWQTLRLSSKSHWDIPIKIGSKTLHILASHPTPPVFDGPEDRNGKRNHDEIRFWHDYITPNNAAYIYDDNMVKGGLPANAPFVILGDQNASHKDGDAITSGISKLLSHTNINDPQPKSAGGSENNTKSSYSAHHTAHWGMRADYVLPSRFGITVLGSGVFWPTSTDKDYRLIKDRRASSDHRLVWVDLKI